MMRASIETSRATYALSVIPSASARARTLAMTAALWLAGCAADAPAPPAPAAVTLTVEDASLTEEATKAAQEWHDVCGIDIVFAPGGMPLSVSTELVVPDAVGQESAESGIEVVPALPAEMQRAVLAHEIGHRLGLVHTTYGIMRPSIIRPVLPSDYHITPKDCPAVLPAKPESDASGALP